LEDPSRCWTIAQKSADAATTITLAAQIQKLRRKAWEQANPKRAGEHGGDAALGTGRKKKARGAEIDASRLQDIKEEYHQMMTFILDQYEKDTMEDCIELLRYMQNCAIAEKAKDRQAANPSPASSAAESDRSSSTAVGASPPKPLRWPMEEVVLAAEEVVEESSAEACDAAASSLGRDVFNSFVNPNYFGPPPGTVDDAGTAEMTVPPALSAAPTADSMELENDSLDLGNVAPVMRSLGGASDRTPIGPTTTDHNPPEAQAHYRSLSATHSRSPSDSHPTSSTATFVPPPMYATAVRAVRKFRAILGSTG